MGAIASGSQEICNYAQEPITVIVGGSGTTFYVNPIILTKNSTFFKAALSGQWRESTTKTVDLPLTDVESFNYYVHWAHKENLESIAAHLGDNKTDKYTLSRFQGLAALYALGDELGDTKLRNAVMDKIIDLANTTGYRPGHRTIVFAFEHLPDNHALRRFLIDDALAGVSAAWLMDQKDSLPEEYLDALLMGWAKASQDKTIKHASPLDMPPCTYHEHDDNVPKGEACNAKRSREEATPPATPASKRTRGARAKQRIEVW